MKTSQEIREKFINYFVKNGHLHLPSASLVPADDPTLLFTTAGMVPFKPYFLGQGIPPSRRITTVQKCFRTTDVERVGVTPRHLTFLEMLGNFSFGDYFKKEAIGFAYEFLTKELGIPVEKLWISVYEEDDEAFEIWHRLIGIPKERIVRLGKEDNFWGPPGPIGPCGPCSEIYYDFGSKNSEDKNCKPGDPCDRFMEIWNLVFMSYYMDESGKLSPLPRKNIDTGMGLERITTVVECVSNVFETDLFQPIILEIRKIINNADTTTERLIADHIRGIVFLMNDGVVPTNEGRGYVLRRLIRRALRRVYKFGKEEPFLYELVPCVVDIMKDAYPELKERSEYIRKILIREEEQFLRTLEQGLNLLEIYFKENQNKIISGDFTFKLYDTYGFPVELTQEIAEESGFKVDIDGFSREMEKQKVRARLSTEEKIENASISLSEEEVFNLEKISPTEFVGYEQTTSQSRVIFFLGGNHNKELLPNNEVYFILDKTPFYAESGGQVSDVGKVYNDETEVVVKDVKKLGEKFIVHRGEVVKGVFKEGIQIIAEIDKEKREATKRHHTATHLLHSALRQILGNHVMQAGSLVNPDFLRFDFTHYATLSDKEIELIERKVNEYIISNYKTDKFWTTLEEARKMGAIALFTEKYQKDVRVIKIDDISMELCGGTHVDYTGEIGSFYILKEEGIGSGIRRIFAVCGLKAWEYQKEKDNLLKSLFTLSGVGSIEELSQRYDKLLKILEEKDKKISSLEEKIIKIEAENLLSKIEELNGVSFLCESTDFEEESIRKLGDLLKSKKENLVIVLFKEMDEKIIGSVMVTPKLIKDGFSAKEIVNYLSNKYYGKGGGRDNLAQVSLPKTDIREIREDLRHLLSK
ncbi:MAG: alanine--tRNA ligase [Dictyoglomaceae bacterium]|nr:alanine--tRNA ligase [Dictyoglomaceae bacterium]HPU43233.1 alanine--tRNA ligase [Dictyoglomaceae bacterium]